MEHLDLLQTIAAIAITLIGFIGIVVTTGRLADGHHQPIDRVVFYSMVAPTLTALVCAFVPELLTSLALPPSAVWRIANAVLGALHLANIAPVLVQVRRLTFTPLQKTFLASGVAFIIAHAATAAGLMPGIVFVFLAGLLQQLAVGIFNFLQLVQSEREGAGS